MDVHSARESVLDMTAEHVKFCAGNEIAISDEVDLNGTLAFIDYATVQRKVWRSRREGDLKLKVDR